MTHIIGFTGRKRSGKDTAAEALHPFGYESLSFAFLIKEMLGVMLEHQGATDEEIHGMLYGDYKEVPTPLLGGKTPRHAMQTLGTEWGRALISDSIWVDATLRAALQVPLVVIPDVRFPNEVKAIQDHGGLVVRITRAGAVVDDHDSERFIDELEVDFELENDGTVEDLHDKVIHSLNVL